ncbi:MAG: hypothetical protein M0002_03070 [Rhodospirillales bacterium]|nr:hypothetical protein [Rhodospirillales bacterium]
MRRRWFLAGGSALALTARTGLAAQTKGVWGRVAGRPDGGLPVLVLAPPAAARGPCPAIIFSHGLGGRAGPFVPVALPWVAAGFVVLLPEHLDSLARGAPRRPSFLELKRYALLRIADIKAILATLPELAGKGDARIVPGAVGVGGHSFGAWTAAVIAGATVYMAAGREQSFADPRPRAFLLLAGPPVPPGTNAMHSFQGFTARSFGDLTRPLLLMDGTRDAAPPGSPGSYRERLAAYALSPPGNKYLGIELNGTHMTMAGLAPARDARLVAIARRSLADMHALSLPFWRGFVSGDAERIAWLNGPAPYGIDPGNLTFERRLG